MLDESKLGFEVGLKLGDRAKFSSGGSIFGRIFEYDRLP